MISIIFGVPGSGKSYYSVWWLRKRALTEGDIFFRVRDDVFLITNLKLNLDSEDNYVYIQDWDGWRKYMDVDFWRSNLAYVRGKKIIMVMDEAQVFFYNYKDDPRVLFFLQYHRHLSIDILLITQTLRSMPQKVIELCEYIIEAVPRSINPFAKFGFRYRVLHPFDRSIVLRRFHLGFDPVVFHLYSDMIYRMDEERPQNAFGRPVFVLASFLFLFVFLFFSFFSTIFSRSQPKSDVVSSGGSSDFTYEDLIWDRPIKSVSNSTVSVSNSTVSLSNSSVSNSTVSLSNSDGSLSLEFGSRLVVPSQPTCHIVIDRSGQGVRSDGPNTSEQLFDGPKITYIP